MKQDVFTAELPVGEKLRVQKNRISGYHRVGPRVAVVTGVHGDELEGQYIAFELARQLESRLENLHGIVDIYPAINPLGINAVQRGVPLFDIDLDRTFPGSADGNLTEVLTHAVMEDIKGADVCVDIHSSGIFMREMPQIQLNLEFAESLMPLAPLLNVNFIWLKETSTEGKSSLAYALNAQQTPCLVVESGLGMRVTEDYGSRLTEGILRLLAHFGGWEGGYVSSLPPIISRDEDISVVHAEHAGVFLPRAKHASVVEMGALLGIIVDPLSGKVLNEVRAPASGLLFTLREYPVVAPGALLARILRGVKK
ncbi:MAG: M14 family metallopeptidase [Atopobiaceae bacterium]